MRPTPDLSKFVKHPSYGYATEEEIEKLKSLGVGWQRNDILKEIKKRTDKLTPKKKRT